MKRTNLKCRELMTGSLQLLQGFINFVYRVKASVCDSGHVKNVMYMGRTLKNEGFYFGHLGNRNLVNMLLLDRLCGLVVRVSD